MKKQGFFICSPDFAGKQNPAPPEWCASLQQLGP